MNTTSLLVTVRKTINMTAAGQSSVELDTEYFVAWYNLGLGLHFTGNLAAAIQAYERAIDISVNISL